MLTVYGIKQCDTCRKALKWLSSQGIEHRFHDFRTDGLDAGLLQDWLDSPFADELVNRRSTSWRQLTEDQKTLKGDKLIVLLLDMPTLIKRPVFVRDEIIAVGFKPEKLYRLL
jgi:Spx/MgsR family transcriptional regulator